MSTEHIPAWRLAFMRRAKADAYIAAEVAEGEARLLAQRIRTARKQVAYFTEIMSPEYRQAQSQWLAQWQARLDSLEDDGVPAILDGDE